MSLDGGADGSVDASIRPADAESTAPAEAGTDGSSSPPDAAPDGAAYDGTIYAIQRPDSVIATGSHVVVDNAGIQVTGVFTDVFFMQEAESRYGGACDWPLDDVVYRGITVQPLAFDATLPVGQRVRVEGEVAEVNGNTTIINAVVTRLGTPAARPYWATCVRTGKSYGEALESVLVEMEGAAVQPAREDIGKPWQIDPCMDNVLVTIGNEMYAFEDWRGLWTIAKGIEREEGGGYRIEPRGPDDVYQNIDTTGDDICL